MAAEVEVARMDEHMLQLRRVLEPLRMQSEFEPMFLDCLLTWNFDVQCPGGGR